MTTTTDTISPLVTAQQLLVRKLESITALTERERAAVEQVPFKLQTMIERRDAVRQGERPTHCCLVVNGWVYRYRSLGQGNHQILAFYVPGDIPDLEGLHIEVVDQPLAIMARATIAFIAHEDIHALIDNFPGVARAFWRDTIVEAIRARERVACLGRRQALGRMAHLFCEMYVRLQAVGLIEGLRYPLPVIQADLADALGMSAVHTNRSLQELRGLGLVTLRSGMLTIDNWNGLVKVAEFDPAYLHIVTRPG